MRNGFSSALLLLLLGAGFSLGQTGGGGKPPEKLPTPPSTSTPGAPLVAFDDAHAGDGRSVHIWGRAEYLTWWIKDHPVPVPLLGSFPGGPGTDPVVVLGGESLYSDLRQGARFSLGATLGCEERFGVEGSVFRLVTQSDNKNVSVSGDGGSPNLFYLFFNAATGTEGTFPLALPGQFSDFTQLSISTALQGAEVNSTFGLMRGCNFKVSGLVGARYIDLRENLNLRSDSPGVDADDSAFLLVDHFGTRNQFYGGQVGVRASGTWCRLFAEATGKVAVGRMHETSDNLGLRGVGTGTTLTTFSPNGQYVLDSNRGRRTNNEIAYIPEVTVNAGVNVTKNLSAFVGYNFLWISEVIRPGDQIDRVINPTQVLGPVVGPARPSVPFNDTTFWAQGVNFGLQFRY